MDSAFLFLMVLPFVSFLYSSVGHGGASGYLALMALFGFAINDMKVIALILNLFVAGIGFYLFWKRGFFNLKLFTAFAIGSIPAAFAGGKIGVDPYWYKKILAFLLLFAIFRMLNVFGKEKVEIKEVKFFPAILLGSLIGFFSGMIGIGGGIILSPVILILGWGRMKETAAVSALFIFVNSGAGLFGTWLNGINLEIDQWVLMSCVLLAVLGGITGAWWGSKIKDLKYLKYVLVFVLLTAVVKLVFV